MIDTEAIVREWMEAAGRHPRVGEGKSDEEFSRMWEASSGTYSFDRYSVIRDDVVRHLDSKGLLEGSVLDIGCGPGTYAVPMASRASSVLAVDLNRGMLDRLEAECRSEGIRNMCTMVCDCRAIPASCRCDLAFTSLCPPMNSPEALMEMEGLGRTCAYVSSCSKDDGLELKVWKALGRSYSYKGYNTDFPFEYLKSVGRDAELVRFKQRQHQESSEDEVVRRFTSLVSRYRELDDGMREAIAGVVADSSEDGIVRTDTETVMGLLVWTPLVHRSPRDTSAEGPGFPGHAPCPRSHHPQVSDRVRRRPCNRHRRRI